MSPVISPSSGFIDSIRFGAQLIQARLTVYTNGIPTSYVVPVSTYQVTVDRNSANRRTGNVTAELIPLNTASVSANLTSQQIFPTGPTSILAPFGTEIFVETGLGTSNVPGSGVVEVTQWVPMGLFAIATTTVADTVNDCTVTLTLYDRSWVISQRALLQPYSFPATPSGNFIAEIQALLNMVWAQDPNAPALQYNIQPTSATVPSASYNQGSDPWQAAQDMANAVGYELFFDVNGVVTGYPIPNPVGQPIVWNFTDNEVAIFGSGGVNGGGGSTSLLGSPYSTPAAITSTMTRDGIYNNVQVTGTGTSNNVASTTGTSSPVIAGAQDNNPASPTYVGGGMGNVPQFVSSNLATTSAQAQTLANNDLQAALASAWQITIEFPPNPMFDIDDVVTVTNERIGLNNVLMVIDSIQYTTSYADTSSITGRVVIPT